LPFHLTIQRIPQRSHCHQNYIHLISFRPVSSQRAHFAISVPAAADPKQGTLRHPFPWNQNFIVPVNRQFRLSNLNVIHQITELAFSPPEDVIHPEQALKENSAWHIHTFFFFVVYPLGLHTRHLAIVDAGGFQLQNRANWGYHFRKVTS